PPSGGGARPPAGGGGGDAGAGGGNPPGDGGGQQPAAPPAARSVPPWRYGNQPDVVVEFAQERLATLGTDNPCTLTQRWTRGVIDAPTRASLVCYQRAVVKSGTEQGKNSAAIFDTDEEGTLGRATLTSLWVQGVRPDQVEAGTTSMQTTQVMAAFWWAMNRDFSDADLDRMRTYSRQGADYFRTGRQTPTRYGSNVSGHIADYQTAVGLTASGTADWPTLRKMLGGSVK
ncbi:hydrolase, partial [Streptomyces sp. NPDC004788]